MTYAERVTALAACWDRWADLGAGLTEADWGRPTRCDGWDVNALYAHHAGYPLGLRNRPGQDPRGDLVTAADLLRGFNAPDSPQVEATAAAVADGARQQATALGRDRLVAAFTEDAREALGWMRETPGETVFPWLGGPASITLTEALRIALMEATIHLYDLQHALGLDPDAPAVAAAETARLLAELPDPAAFIEAASGRSETPVLPVLR
ncbi:maleylpyruvate isomerase N-terminal domain-containing protein [Microlunatus sp. GCM10028923]|uniref:maleylpyruvate isomerase N-terminal domain-containing protein n=1 Tax=Microlunatus sp. GCM10028923 TaxID=3273400 RepID=UPI00360C60EF